MIRVHAIDAGNRHLYDHELEQHHRIRHDIYVGERKWMDLARPDGREVDQFDTVNAVYLLAVEPGKGVVGGSRLVPTLDPPWKQKDQAQDPPGWVAAEDGAHGRHSGLRSIRPSSG